VKLKKKAIIFFPHKPYPPRTGAHHRCLAILDGLQELGYDVTLFGSNLITDNPWPVDNVSEMQKIQFQLGVKIEVYQGSQTDYQYMADMSARKKLVNWDLYTPPGLKNRFCELFRECSPDVVLINYSLWGELARGVEFKSALTIIDTIDLYTLNIKMRQALEQYLNLTPLPFNPDNINLNIVAEDFYSKLALEAEPDEYRIFDQYNCTIAISEQEAESIRQHTQLTQVEYIPMTFTPVIASNTYNGNPLFAVGPNPFNVQGYLYLANKILPIILSELPEFKIQIVGSICQQLLPVKGIELLGFVPELKPLYAESGFAVCPLLGGTGQQVKIVEAMAHGVPAITFRNVAETSPIEHGINGFIAENAEEFAEYAVRLYRDRELCRQLGQAARATIIDKFSRNLLVDKLKSITDQAVEKPKRACQTLIVDGIFFQLYKAGIARVWHSLLEEWAKNGFAKHIVVLDRAGTAPKITGINYRTISAYNYQTVEEDRQMLQQVCDEEGADLFISTYYTTPLSTPSTFMAYDMIPEVTGVDINQPMWREKHNSIRQASTYISISKNTACDLVRFFPDISLDSIAIAYCGIKNNFSQSTQEEVNIFLTKYGISKPYFLIVSIGDGSKNTILGYKNTILFFQAFFKLRAKQRFEIVCTGGGILDDEFMVYTSNTTVHYLELSDDELRVAYSGAMSLIYPSKYEGFGLPLLEAMACGCPVITCPNASIPEVAGAAALYVEDDDIEGLINALCEIQKPAVRNSLTAAGFKQIKKFSWSKMAHIVSSHLIEATLWRLNLRLINLIIFPDWSVPENDLFRELESVIRVLLRHPKQNEINLLIDTSNVSEEDANLILSSVTMNILIREDFPITEDPAISLMGQISELQWQTLLPRIQYRILLENENQEALAQARTETISSCTLDRLGDKEARIL
jgi:glycosyltransferase involved in cell wall biosynthesis